MTRMDYKIDGLSCNHCVSNVKNALEQLEGVEKVLVSLEDSKVSIFAENQPELTRLNETLKGAGHYKISKT